MSAITKTEFTPEEYLEFERNSEERYEYFDGEIFVMSGAEDNHNKIATNLGDLVWQHLNDKYCESYSNDMGGFIPETGLHDYPELVVVRGEPRFQEDVFDSVWQHLKGKDCEYYANYMRVFVSETGLYTYPDLFVVLDEPQFQDDVFDTLLNPILIIEVLSDSTEGCDRGRKFQHYRSIESLREYVLVAQNEARIEKYVKSGDGFWILSEAVGLDAEIKFDAIDCVIRLREVYDKVNFEDE